MDDGVTAACRFRKRLSITNITAIQQIKTDDLVAGVAQARHNGTTNGPLVPGHQQTHARHYSVTRARSGIATMQR